jgi:acyl carrier protein phosphodiesterase
MNFLAHTYLSFSVPGIIVGNYLGDFVKNREVVLLPPVVREGIHLHRYIDSFTDSHQSVKAGTKLLHKSMGKYAPVVLDIYFDFLLSKRWSDFSDIPLEKFCKGSYEALLSHRSIMPLPIATRMQKMVYDRWLENYQTYAGLQRVFGFLSRRAKFKSNLDRAPDVLVQIEGQLESIFIDFFPVIIDSVKKESGTRLNEPEHFKGKNDNIKK